MKTRKNLVLIAMMMAAVLVVKLALAQSPANSPAPRVLTRAQLRAEVRAMLAATPKAGPMQEPSKKPKPYPQDEIAETRSALIDLATSIKEMSQLAPGRFATDKLDQAIAQLTEVPDEVLVKLSKALNPSMMREEIGAVRTTVSEYKMTLEKRREWRASRGEIIAKSTPFPTATGNCSTITFTVPPAPTPFPGSTPIPTPNASPNATPTPQEFGPDRIPVGVILAVDIVYFTAELVRDLAQDACSQSVLGFNAEILCTIVDIVYVAAHAFQFGVHFCEDDLTGNVVDASYQRLFHLHNDLTASTASIINNAAANVTTIVNNDNSNKTTIINNDNANTTAIQNNDNSNTTNIMNNDNGNRTTIVNNDNANANLLHDLLLRTQIEADLAAPDNAIPLALFETPSTECSGASPVNQCGELDFVRQIVAQTITRLGGSSITQANAFLLKGDQYKVAGNYKAAYQQYRQAYKAAAK